MDKLNLARLAEGFIKSYSGFMLSTSDSYTKFTNFELNHWAKLGNMMGYETYQEYAFKNDGRPADLLWYESDKEGIEPILHLEKENKYWEKFEETIDGKLLSNNNKMKNAIYCVGIFDRFKENDEFKIEDMLKYTKNKITTQKGCNELLLIFYDPTSWKTWDGIDITENDIHIWLIKSGIRKYYKSKLLIKNGYIYSEWIGK